MGLDSYAETITRQMQDAINYEMLRWMTWFAHHRPIDIPLPPKTAPPRPDLKEPGGWWSRLAETWGPA